MKKETGGKKVRMKMSVSKNKYVSSYGDSLFCYFFQIAR